MLGMQTGFLIYDLNVISTIFVCFKVVIQSDIHWSVSVNINMLSYKPQHFLYTIMYSYYMKQSNEIKIVNPEYSVHNEIHHLEDHDIDIHKHFQNA